MRIDTYFEAPLGLVFCFEISGMSGWDGLLAAREFTDLRAMLDLDREKLRRNLTRDVIGSNAWPPSVAMLVAPKDRGRFRQSHRPVFRDCSVRRDEIAPGLPAAGLRK